MNNALFRCLKFLPRNKMLNEVDNKMVTDDISQRKTHRNHFQEHTSVYLHITDNNENT